MGYRELQTSLQEGVELPTPSSPFLTAWRNLPKAGATAVIHPRGSIRDSDVIAAADRLGLAMVFTRLRHFLH